MLEYAVLLDIGREFFFFYNGRDCHTAWRLLTAPGCYHFFCLFLATNDNEMLHNEGVITEEKAVAFQTQALWQTIDNGNWTPL
jgi:hypothetical protein